MKPLTPAEMSSLYCGLFATADALKKAADAAAIEPSDFVLGSERENELLDRAAWCTAMATTIRSKFLAAKDDKDDKSPWRSKKHPNRPMSPEDVAMNEKWFPQD